MSPSRTTKKPIEPLPYPVYFWTIFIIALTGVADSVYLFTSHYRVYTDVYYSSFCAISKAINCDTVSQSPYSIFLGLPLAVWGVLGYAGFLSALVMLSDGKDQTSRGWSTLFLISLTFSIHSIILALISATIIHSYCLMCILLYGINFSLMFLAWLTARRFSSENLLSGIRTDFQFMLSTWKKGGLYLLPLIGILVSAFILIPPYWNISPPPPENAVKSGKTTDGYPWIGAADPELTITEFIDYQCFQCRKMHSFLRRLIAQYPEKIRLVHRHFPMDRDINPIVTDEFHKGSGNLAILSQYAAHRNKFWEMNDTLMALAGKSNLIDLKELADSLGLDFSEMQHSLTNKSIRYHVKHDISVGLALGLDGTPGYLINGVLYKGNIPPSILKDLL